MVLNSSLHSSLCAELKNVEEATARSALSAELESIEPLEETAALRTLCAELENVEPPEEAALRSTLYSDFANVEPLADATALRWPPLLQHLRCQLWLSVYDTQHSSLRSSLCAEHKNIELLEETTTRSTLCADLENLEEA